VWADLVGKDKELQSQMGNVKEQLRQANESLADYKQRASIAEVSC
jgi:hypothetical protein